MKHLIALSFKYLKRQKTRTALTFLCILLAVFIFNTFSAYLSSTLATLANFEREQSGSWQVDLDNVLKHCKDQQETYRTLDQHAVVEDYYYYHTEGIWAGLSERDENGVTRYLKIDFDNGETGAVYGVSHYQELGNLELPYSKEELEYEIDYNHLQEDEVTLPDWVAELGYAVGDTITFSLTPVKVQIPEDSAQIQAVRQWIAEHSNEEEGYWVMDDPDPVEPNYSGAMLYGESMLYYLQMLYGPDGVEFTEKTEGTPVTMTFTIAGFQEGYRPRSFAMHAHPNNPVTLAGLFAGENAAIWEGSGANLYTECGGKVRISEQIDFDEGLELLLAALGLEPRYRYDMALHDELLAYEMRSAQAIAAIMPLICAILLLALLAWFICRFVIDNAFEISVQERSAQFAVLRIMGASKAQLTALIFTEAVVYCLTAVPLGIVTAFLACKMVMEGIGGTLFSAFTFAVNPVITALGILISVTRLFISAYTSALWAAGRLSPMAAVQYGKPLKLRRRKSLLKRGRGEFMVDYTMKNITRTKNRYLIATVAMTLGVMMFTFSTLGVHYANISNKAIQARTDLYDYQIDCFDVQPDMMTAAQETFADNPDFSKCEMYAASTFVLEDMDGMAEMAASFTEGRDPVWDQGWLAVRMVDRTTYETVLEPITGLDYDTFAASGAAMLGLPYQGTQAQDGWQSAEAAGFAALPRVISDTGKEIPFCGAVSYAVERYSLQYGSLLLPMDTAYPIANLDSLYTTILLNVNGHACYEAAKTTVTAFCNKYLMFALDNYWENTGSTTFFTTIFQTLSVFLVSVWLVGILTMVNSINTSVLNRRGELRMLRYVGMTKRQLYGSIVLEGVLYSAVSTLLGLALGVLGYMIFIDYLNWAEMQLTFGAVFIQPVILIVTVTLLLNLLIAALAALPAKRQLEQELG